MPAINKDLLALEKKFWTGDEAFYRDNADTSCLVAFADMSGVMPNKKLAATAKDGQKWKKLDIKEKGVVQPTDDVAVLTYEAKGVRASGEAYSAIVSTGYVKRETGWKMMFHSQTPLAMDKPKAKAADAKSTAKAPAAKSMAKSARVNAKPKASTAKSKKLA